MVHREEKVASTLEVVEAHGWARQAGRSWKHLSCFPEGVMRGRRDPDLLPHVVPRVGCHETKHLHGDDHGCCLQGFTLACVFIWEVRPSLNYTGHGQGLSTLTCFLSSLLNIHFQEGLWAIEYWVFSSCVQWGTLFFHRCCWFSSSLFWLTLWICLWNRKSSASPFWLRCHIYNSNAYLEVLTTFTKRASFCRWYLESTYTVLSVTQRLLQMKYKQEFWTLVLKYVESQRNPLENGTATHSSILA